MYTHPLFFTCESVLEVSIQRVPPTAVWCRLLQGVGLRLHNGDAINGLELLEESALSGHRRCWDLWMQDPPKNAINIIKCVKIQSIKKMYDFLFVLFKHL